MLLIRVPLEADHPFRFQAPTHFSIPKELDVDPDSCLTLHEFYALRYFKAAHEIDYTGVPEADKAHYKKKPTKFYVWARLSTHGLTGLGWT